MAEDGFVDHEGCSGLISFFNNVTRLTFAGPSLLALTVVFLHIRVQSSDACFVNFKLTVEVFSSFVDTCF